MVQQLQLFECETLHRNGNTPLKVLLSRLSQGPLTVDNAKVYCQKIQRLGVQDIKDIIFEARHTQIPPDIVDLLFALSCETHQKIYQKSLANAWLNRSFDICITQSTPTHSMSVCRLVAEWNNLGVIEMERNVKIRIWNLMLNLDQHMMQSIKDTPVVVSMFFNMMLEVEHELKNNTYSALKVANLLNNVADVLSDQQCNAAQKLFENLKLWGSIHCENLYTQVAKIQKNTLLGVVETAQRPAIVRKI